MFQESIAFYLTQADYIKSPGSDAPIYPKVSEETLHAPFKV